MIFWFGNDDYCENVLIRYFSVEGFNSLIFFDKKVLNKNGKVDKYINRRVFFPVVRNGIVMVKHISAVFEDAVLIYDKYPKLHLKQVIPVVTREQILSGEKLPKSVAVLEQDPNLIRSLFERKKRITWFVKRLPKVMPYIFFYNFEHLILNPFGTFQIHYDGTFRETDSIPELFKRNNFGRLVLGENFGRAKTFFGLRFLYFMFFYRNEPLYRKNTIRPNRSLKMKEIVAWYNILSIYRGLYDFSQQLYGKRTNTSSSSGKRRTRVDSAGRNEGPSVDSKEIGSSY